MTTIFVTGSTGTVGSQVVKALAGRKGVTVRAAVRAADKAAVPEGVRKVPFEYGDASRMREAFTGVDALFLLTPYVEDPLPLAQGAIDAAKAAGVRRIVKLSAIGCEVEPGISLGRSHRAVERYIEASGLPWTFLRANNFMENFIGFYPPGPDGVIYLPWGNAGCSLIDARDVGAVAAVALTEEGHTGKAYALTGQTAPTVAEVAAILGEVSGRAITYVDVPEAAAEKGMLDAGLPVWMVKGLMELHAVDKAGYAAAVTEDVQRVTGRPATPFAQFARDHASAWKPR